MLAQCIHRDPLCFVHLPIGVMGEHKIKFHIREIVRVTPGEKNSFFGFAARYQPPHHGSPETMVVMGIEHFNHASFQLKSRLAPDGVNGIRLIGRPARQKTQGGAVLDHQ